LQLIALDFINPFGLLTSAITLIGCFERHGGLFRLDCPFDLRAEPFYLVGFLLRCQVQIQLQILKV